MRFIQIKDTSYDIIESEHLGHDATLLGAVQL